MAAAETRQDQPCPHTQRHGRFESDDLLAQSARGIREREARRESSIDQLERLDHNIEDLMIDDELDAALGQGRR